MYVAACRGTPLQHVRWHPRQASSLVDYERDGGLIIKYTKNKFGRVSSINEFVHAWDVTSRVKPGLPVYELIPTTSHARLHIDVEGCYTSNEDQDVRLWLSKIMDCVKRALATHHGSDNPAFHMCLCMNDSRGGPQGMTKRSFHLIWPDVIFPNNYHHMHSFITQCVQPLLVDDPDMFWERSKQGTTKTMEKVCALDTGIYTRNRVFRVVFAGKDESSSTFLRPWDPLNWQDVDLNDQTVRRTFIARTLITARESKAIVLECQPGGTRPSRRKRKTPTAQTQGDKLTPRGMTAQHSRMQKEPPPPPTEEDRMDLALLLPLLDTARAYDYSTWARVGWIIARTFVGHDEKGRALFHSFSQRASNYDAESVEHMYSAYDNSYRLGIGTVTMMVQIDNPRGYHAMMKVKKNRRLFANLFNS